MGDTAAEIQAWQLAHIEEGLAQAKRGETVAHDKVKRWLASWGTKRETKPPRCPTPKRRAAQPANSRLP